MRSRGSGLGFGVQRVPFFAWFIPGSSLVFLVPGFPVSVFSHYFPFFSVFLCFAFSLVSLLSFLSSVSARVWVSGRVRFSRFSALHPWRFESRGVSCPLRPCVCGGLVCGWWSVVSTHCVRSAAFSVSPTFVALEVQMQMFKLMSQHAVLGRPGKESAPTRNRQTSPTSCR